MLGEPVAPEAEACLCHQIGDFLRTNPHKNGGFPRVNLPVALDKLLNLSMPQFLLCTMRTIQLYNNMSSHRLGHDLGLSCLEKRLKGAFGPLAPGSCCGTLAGRGSL